MRDIIERMEDAAEQEFYEMTKDCPEGYFKCDCGRVAHLDNAHPIANSPWAMPVCGDCFDEFVESFNKQESKR